MMGWETVTVWSRTPAGWARSVWSNVRVEVSRSIEPGGVGPVSDGTTRAFFFSPTAIKPGDCMMVGVHREAEPPEEALEVRTVDPYSLRSAHHHTEVKAR